MTCILCHSSPARFFQHTWNLNPAEFTNHTLRILLLNKAPWLYSALLAEVATRCYGMIGLSLVLAQANSSRIYYWLPNHHLAKSTFNDVFLQQTTYNVTRHWCSKNITSAQKQGNREIAVSFSGSRGNARAESLVEINSCDYFSPSDTSLFCCPVHKCLESSGAMVSRFLIEVYFDSTVTSLLMWWYPNRNSISKILWILSVSSF